MSFNLLDSVKGMFTSDLISKAGNLLGENESSVQRAVSGIVPSVLAGILSKAGSGDVGSMLNMAKSAVSSGMLSNISDFSGGNFLTKGADMLKGLFGDRTSDVTNTVAGFAGIKTTSAASLMSIAAPAALGALGKHAESTGMNAGGLLSFLNSQKDSILNSLPSGLNLAGALGLGSIGSIGNKLSEAFSGVTGAVKNMPAQAAQTAQKAGSNRWVLPLLLVVGVVALIWFLTRPKNTDGQPEVASINASATDTPSTTATTVSLESIKVKLPNGIELDAYKGGIEDQLVNFLNDPSMQVNKDTWFDFDNLNFETGSATITPQSMQQVQNISAILKAFPKSSIKIGGYTDKTGDSVSNLKLSQARAEAVVASLTNNGAKASQLAGAEGYGSQFAKAAADATDEERKKDRRIAVSVREK